MMRQTKEQLDAAILDQAAALFARFGFRRTTVQAVADAVGYSKAGLLHRYPSKDALAQAVVEACVSDIERCADSVEHMPVGFARDRQVIETLVSHAHKTPGLTTLLLSVVDLDDDHDLAKRLDDVPPALFRMFGATMCSEDHDRNIRIGAACGGLAVIALGASSRGDADALNQSDVQRIIVQTCLNTLGHFPDQTTTKEP